MNFISLFSGIDAASVAWLPLGWRCVAFSEIDKFPCAVLRQYYPDVPNLGDVTKITKARISALGPVDAVVFGFPCQDLSVAGKRAGLKGERSGLFFDAMRIVRWSRARWAIAENVPGLFSSNGGLDFAAVAGEMAGVRVDVPDGGWANTGVLAGVDGLVEWATLDAQYFGVPQRRRRVFLVRDTGNWRGRAPVLFERHSLSGHPPPRREKGQGTAHELAPSLTGSGSGRGTERTGESRGQDPVIAVAFGGNNCSGPIDIATAVNACSSASGRMDFESETFVAIQAGCVRENPDSDHESREGLLVPVGVTIHGTDGTASVASYTETCSSLRSRVPGCVENSTTTAVLAFTCKDHGAEAGNISPTLRSMGHDGSHANAGGQVAVAFQSSQSGVREVETHATLDSNNGSRRHNGVIQGMAVRRLTPRECERLQGFPDDYTKISDKTADGPRYKALGNSMAVPVMRWIGERIQAVENLGPLIRPHALSDLPLELCLTEEILESVGDVDG